MGPMGLQSLYKTVIVLVPFARGGVSDFHTCFRCENFGV